MHRRGVDILTNLMQTAVKHFACLTDGRGEKGTPYKWEISGERRQK